MSSGKTVTSDCVVEPDDETNKKLWENTFLSLIIILQYKNSWCDFEVANIIQKLLKYYKDIGLMEK